MSKGKNEKILLGSGLILAFTSSLCCIAPILAIISGTGNAVAPFNWAAPLRPYFIGATVLVLGLAFYRTYKPQPKDECGCEEKKGVLQSRTFLWIIATVSILLSAFPWYARYFQPNARQQTEIRNTPDVQEAGLPSSYDKVGRDSSNKQDDCCKKKM